MLFTSYEFLSFFVILFLLYYLMPRKRQWFILLLGSYLFYFQANPCYLIYMIAITALTYVAAYMIDRNLENQKHYLKEYGSELDRESKKTYKKRQLQLRHRWKVFCIIAVIAILAITKYTNFMISNVNSLLNRFSDFGNISFVNIVLPLGISFYTFMAIGYVIDVYRENIKAEKNFLKLALFLSFFPQLIQGPISRFGALSQTLYREHSFDAKQVCFGIQRMLWGYFKKLVIADRILIAVSHIINNPERFSGAYAFVGMVFYTIELYADFTGGIDITIGIAQAFGIRMEENFVRPYFSKSLKEYWRRWHISMSTWFKDYIFYPVSVSKAMQRLSKLTRKYVGERAGKRLPVYLSSFLVWLATGIWHGASWNFVVWGLLNWGILMISEELEPLYTKFHKLFCVGNKRTYQLFQILRTFLLICILNLFDCYEAVGTTINMLYSIIRADNWSILVDGTLLNMGMDMSDYVVLLVGSMILLGVSLLQRNGSVRSKIERLCYPIRVCIWFGLFLIIILFGNYGIGYDASQFIYNRF